MKLTLDFDENTVTTEDGTIVVPGLAEKEPAILELLGLEKIPMEELRKDLNDLMDELGLNVKV